MYEKEMYLKYLYFVIHFCLSSYVNMYYQDGNGEMNVKGGIEHDSEQHNKVLLKNVIY